MDTNWLKIIYALNGIFTALATLENDTRTVNVLAVVFSPFTYVDSNNEFIGGIDVQILKTIANRQNLKINWYKIDSIAQISTTKLKKFDVVIGGIRPDFFHNFTDFVASAPYMQDDLTWCVSHAKAIPRWRNIYYIPQDSTTYAWGGIMYIITIFGPFTFSTFEKKPLDIFCCAILSLQTLVGFSSTFKPKRSILRFHFAIFLFISFWLTQILSAFLIIYNRRILYENQISSLNEIVGNDFHLAGDGYIFDYLNVKNVFSQEQLSNFEVCNEIDKCLYRLEYDDRLAVATSRYYIRAMPLQRNIFCFDQSQNIHSYLATFAIRNDFPMKHEFDDMLKRIVTSGLLSKWQKDLQLYRVSAELDSEEESLSLTHFSYAFMILIGVIVSILALFVELFISYKTNAVNASKYWKLLDKLICGKRYFFLLEPRNDDVIIPFTK